MANYNQFSATAQLKVGAARLVSLTISTTSSGTIVIYDSPDGDTNDPKVVNTLTPAAGTHFYWGDEGLALNNGLYIVIANTLTGTIGFK